MIILNNNRRTLTPKNMPQSYAIHSSYQVAGLMHRPTWGSVVPRMRPSSWLMLDSGWLSSWMRGPVGGGMSSAKRPRATWMPTLQPSTCTNQAQVSCTRQSLHLGHPSRTRHVRIQGSRYRQRSSRRPVKRKSYQGLQTAVACTMLAAVQIKIKPGLAYHCSLQAFRHPRS